MDPVTQTFNETKRQIMDAFPSALEAFKMSLIGRNDRLGLISFQHESKPILYAHIVEHPNSTTRISIAPGLPYLKDREPSEMPASSIQRVLNKLQTVTHDNT